MPSCLLSRALLLYKRRVPPVPFTVMGVVNVTPDSFSDGGLFLDPAAAIDHGLELAGEGAGILDVGGESTRPGAEPVAEEEELARVVPVVEGLATGVARISIDTSKLAVAEERVWLDPGIGFGKRVEHNLELLRRLDEICAIGRPVVVGTSRKSFLGRLAGGRPEGERLPGTIATNVLALERGASVFRVHDVAPVADALEVAAATVAP